MKTRDYVIRREFDFGEGDAYNKTLIDRAERRLKNLNYFKTVKITTRPGSAPDRVVLDVEAVDQADRRFQHRRRLLDHRRLDGRGQGRRPQFLRHRRQRAGRRELRTIWARRQHLRHRSVAVRQPCLRRRRAVRPADLRQPLSVLWQQHLRRQFHRRHPGHRDDSRAVALFALRPEHHAQSGIAGGNAIAAGAAGRGRRTATGFRGRRHRHLQHARQQQAADQRHQFATAARISPASAAT